MADGVIAVTGATGKLGSRVARLLVDRGARVRLVVRTSSSPPAGLGEVVSTGGYRDEDGMRAALRGCSTLFLVSGREAADRLQQHLTVVGAARAAGVERVVYTSFQGAGPQCTFTLGRDHWHTEEAIRAAGLGFTFLRDSFYLGMIPVLCGPDGVIRGPAGDGRVAAVAHDDVAAVAASALLDDGLDGQSLDVTGPRAFSLAEAAAELSAVSGVEVRFENESEAEAYASRAGFGAPDFEVAGWVTSYQSIAAGEVSRVSDTVERLTGAAPQSLPDYLRSHPDEWAHLSRSTRG